MNELLFIITVLTAYLLTFIFLLKRIINFYRKFDLRVAKESITDLITEGFFLYVFPGVAIFLTNDPCDVHPFEIESTPTAVTCWLIFAVAHACSKYYKSCFSPVLLVIITTALIFGILFCVVLCVHFSLAYFLLAAPLFNLLYLCPLFCLLYLLKEAYNLSLYLREASLKKKYPEALNAFYKTLERYHLGFAAYLLAPFAALVQALLYLLGQRPDSLISQFTDSCGFFLSHQQNCSCGGDHYLCSIAANGNKLLVKPVRMGLRKNEKIIVNRQLLIANAFENWLEDHTPTVHKRVRKAYDDCRIPVNAWSKHKNFANVLYIVMKPLEWSFLLWLYLMDKHPEDRIARQYLPKHELNAYLNKRITHENNH